MPGAPRLFHAQDNPQRKLLTTLRTADPSHKTHRTRSAAQTTKPPPTRNARNPQFPRVAPDADTPRGRPGGRPLGVSHQHSASTPSKLLNMSLVGITRARVARAVFPCDDTYCKRPTLRQRQGQLRKSWDFDPTDNRKQNECAPPGDRGLNCLPFLGHRN